MGDGPLTLVAWGWREMLAFGRFLGCRADHWWNLGGQSRLQAQITCLPPWGSAAFGNARVAHLVATVDAYGVNANPRRGIRTSLRRRSCHASATCSGPSGSHRVCKSTEMTAINRCVDYGFPKRNVLSRITLTVLSTSVCEGCRVWVLPPRQP